MFLTLEGAPALSAGRDVLKTQDNFLAWVWPLVFGTLLAAALALLIAVPLALAVATRRGALGGLRPVGHRLSGSQAR